MNALNPTMPRPWLRFSLRSLLVLMVLVAIPLAWKFNRVRAQQRAIKTIRETGGSVQYAPGLMRLNDLLGEGFADVIGVSLGDPASTEVFEVLSQLPELAALRFRANSLTNDALKQLQKCPRLRHLAIDSHKDMDQTLSDRLEALPQCEVFFYPDPDGRIR